MDGAVSRPRALISGREAGLAENWAVVIRLVVLVDSIGYAMMACIVQAIATLSHDDSYNTAAHGHKMPLWTPRSGVCPLIIIHGPSAVGCRARPKKENASITFQPVAHLAHRYPSYLAVFIQ